MDTTVVIADKTVKCATLMGQPSMAELCLRIVGWNKEAVGYCIQR